MATFSGSKQRHRISRTVGNTTLTSNEQFRYAVSKFPKSVRGNESRADTDRVRASRNRNCFIDGYGHRSPSAYLRTIGRTFAFAAVLAYLPTWNNEIASVVDTTVKETLKADPARVYDQYQKALAVNKGTDTGTGSKSWWDSSIAAPELIMRGSIAVENEG